MVGMIQCPTDGDFETRVLTNLVINGLDDQVSPFEVTDALTSVVHTRTYIEVKNLINGKYYMIQIDEVQ